MNRLTKAFKSQRSQYGGYAALLTTIIIIIVIAINLLVSEINWTYDASENKFFSISEESEEIAKGVDEPVSIYGLFETGAESPAFDMIINNYTKLSRNITASNIDPIRNPAFSMQYADEGESLPEGTYIVVAENTNRYKIISSEDIMDSSYNITTGQQVNSLALEKQLTSAIKYVTLDELPVIYQVLGHGEETLPALAIKEMELENYQLNELVLLDEGEVPEDCDVLIINAPIVDINEDELAILSAYFNNFGAAMFMMGMVDEPMPNFTRLFENYGVQVHQNSIVFENNVGNFYQSPVLLVPNIMEHAITEPLQKQNLRLTAMTSQYIQPLDIVRDELVIEPLLTSSNSSYAKTDVTDDIIVEREEGDADGPFIIAAAVTDNKEWDSSIGVYHSSKMVLIANSLFLLPEAYAAEPNYDFLIYCTNWLSDAGDTSPMYIRPKDLSVMLLQMNGIQIYIYAALAVIVIPLAILVIGFVVWSKRRHL